MRTTDQDANKLIEFLVANGANLYAKNNKGRTALDESEGEEITPENGGGGPPPCDSEFSPLIPRSFLGRSGLFRGPSPILWRPIRGGRGSPDGPAVPTL